MKICSLILIALSLPTPKTASGLNIIIACKDDFMPYGQKKDFFLTAVPYLSIFDYLCVSGFFGALPF